MGFSLAQRVYDEGGATDPLRGTAGEVIGRCRGQVGGVKSVWSSVILSDQ